MFQQSKTKTSFNNKVYMIKKKTIYNKFVKSLACSPKVNGLSKLNALRSLQ